MVDLAEGETAARERILGSLRPGADEVRADTSGLIGAVGLALQDGTQRLAAQLLGAVNATLARQGLAVEPLMQGFHAQVVAKAKAVLGEADFKAAWGEGGLWSVAEVGLLALEKDT